jgi:hypothetical protein
LVRQPTRTRGGTAPSTIYNKKGDSILFTATAEQCFFAADGIATADPLGSFCGGPSDAFFSTSTGPFTIVGRTGKFLDATGGGTITSAVSHCEFGPFGNFGESEVTGTLVVP